VSIAQGCSYLPPLATDHERIALVSIYALIMMIAIPGNLIIIVTILKSPRLRENVTFMFVLSVSIADFLVASLAETFALSTIALSNQNSVICDAAFTTGFVSAGASITGVIGITLERFLFIVHPFTHDKVMTKKKVCCIILVLWCVGLSPGVMFLFGFNPKLIQGIAVGNYFVTFMISITANSKFLSMAMEKMRKDEKQGNMSSGVKSIRKRQIQTTLLILKICVVFAVCWLPYGVLGLVIAANKIKKTSKTVFTLYYWSVPLGYSNSALNVFIYGMGNTVLSEEVKNTLNCNKSAGNL